MNFLQPKYAKMFFYFSMKTYRNQPNYRICSYKRTVKQFSSLYITASVFLSTSL